MIKFLTERPYWTFCNKQPQWVLDSLSDQEEGLVWRSVPASQWAWLDLQMRSGSETMSHNWRSERGCSIHIHHLFFCRIQLTSLFLASKHNSFHQFPISKMTKLLLCGLLFWIDWGVGERGFTKSRGHICPLRPVLISVHKPPGESSL